MRKTRIFAIIVFLIALSIYGLYRLYGIRVLDKHGAEITMDSEEITISSGDDKSAILNGVHAVDIRDGDISDQLMIENLSNFVDNGRRIASIASIDSDNNVVKVTRDVIYNDYKSPQFQLTGPLKFPAENSDLDILSSVTASDVIDGDLTDYVKLSGAYYLRTSPGEYPMEYQVTNSAGDVSKLKVTVTLYDPEVENGLPKIELSEYLINVPAGEKVSLKSYITSVRVNGRTYENLDGGSVLFADGYEQAVEEEWDNADSYMLNLKQIKKEGDVDFNTPGTYEVVFKVTDDDENVGSERLVVVVY